MLSQNFEHGKVIKNENKNISRKNKNPPICKMKQTSEILRN